MGSREHSENIRARYQREARKVKSNQRKFNDPMKEFIEHKYPKIFQEYTELYQKLIAEYPHRKNLTRTSMFRQWIRTETPAETPDVLTQALRETFEHQEQQQPLEHPLLEAPQQDPQQFYNEIDEILAEIIANDRPRDIFEAREPPEDEGIELNIEDEIHGDIEPFDFALEVELYEW